MPRKMAKIPEPAKQTPTEKQPLRVVAYCRVSARHEEQCHSLKAQIAYYTDYIERNLNWEFVAVYSDIGIQHPYSKPPWLSEAHERLHQKKDRLDPGKSSQPFWPGRIGNHSSN